MSAARGSHVTRTEGSRGGPVELHKEDLLEQVSLLREILVRASYGCDAHIWNNEGALLSRHVRLLVEEI